MTSLSPTLLTGYNFLKAEKILSKKINTPEQLSHSVTYLDYIITVKSKLSYWHARKNSGLIQTQLPFSSLKFYTNLSIPKKQLPVPTVMLMKHSTVSPPWGNRNSDQSSLSLWDTQILQMIFFNNNNKNPSPKLPCIEKEQWTSFPGSIKDNVDGIYPISFVPL
jgi:hypothetical protein